MQISACEIDRFEAPLLKALPRTTALVRKGLYVTVRLRNGDSATGEIAPLEGFSTETLDEAQLQAVELAHSLVGTELNDIRLRKRMLYSSVRCGFELVFEKLSRDSSGWWHSSEFKTTPVQVCALLDPAQLMTEGAAARAGQTLDAQTRTLVRKGYTRFKLKVAGGSIDDDVKAILAVSGAMGDHSKIRLDANRRWSVEDVQKILGQIDRSKIDFLEEPLEDPFQLKRLSEECGVSIALDESFGLIAGEKPDFEKLQWLTAIVLKPMLHGGYGRSIELAQSAAQYDISTVVSSSFETSIGHDALVRLWGTLPDPRMVAGLDTQHYYGDHSVSAVYGTELSRIYPN